MVFLNRVNLLTVLGSTGSIGVNTLNVVRQWPERFGIYALVAGRNVELLAQQIAEFRPKVAVVADEESAKKLRKINTIPGVEIDYGPRARVAAAIAPDVGFVLSAIVGVEGLEATYEAIKHRKRIGLANKEVLVSAGKLVMAACEETGAELIPVDSEHNGAHQCLRGGLRTEVLKLILSASYFTGKRSVIRKLRSPLASAFSPAPSATAVALSSAAFCAAFTFIVF